MDNDKINKFTFWGLSIFIIFVCGIFGDIFLSEWYKVAILNTTKDYHFGEANKPFFFATSKRYASYSLTFGIIYLIIILSTILALIKKQKMRSFVAMLATVLTLIIAFVIGNINV